MPNWSEGVLKIRGTKEQIENFIRNGIAYEDYKFNLGTDKQDNRGLIETSVPRDCPIEIGEDEITVKNTMDLYIKDTRRMFINSKDIYTYYRNSKEENKFIIYIDVRQAWGIIAGNLQEISKKYGVDFKILATEQGMEFCQDVEIVNGEIVTNDDITFDDFQWEAPDPRIGG